MDEEQTPLFVADKVSDDNSNVLNTHEQLKKSLISIFALVLLVSWVGMSSTFQATSREKSSIPLKLLAQTPLAQSETQCTPFYQECTCQTVALSCEQVNDMYNDIASFITTARNSPAPMSEVPSRSGNIGALIGAMVRLPFHDAGEFNPATFKEDKLRSDGCVDLSQPANNGLADIIESLDALWKPWCSVISRADFWVLAGKVAVETSTPYLAANKDLGSDVDAPGASLKDNFGQHELYWIPFNYGRIDNPHCKVTTENLPDAMGGALEIKTNIMDKFGVDVPHAVALIGAHTLGGAFEDESGFDGIWTSRPDLFDTVYFKNLKAFDWERISEGSGGEGSNLNQWVPTQATGEFTFMLNTDLAMIYDVNGESGEIGQICSSEGTTRRNSCPYVSSTYPVLNFNTFVDYFSEGTGAAQDEPGASRFLTFYANAYTKMTQTGYTDGSLQCAYCPPNSCKTWGCTEEQICSSGVLDNMSDIPGKGCVNCS